MRAHMCMNFHLIKQLLVCFVSGQTYAMLLLLIKFLFLVAFAAVTASTSVGGGDTASVRTVHLVFSHHLDVGLNEALRFVGFCEGFATKIVQEYFDDFIPRAIRIAKEVNADIAASERDGRFAYTVHPWIASLYVDCVSWSVIDGCALNPGKLRCPTKQQVAAFDEAVHRGDILWADSPMNVNAGIVGEPGTFEALFDIAGALNERYNITKLARVWSNVDVPGFSRSAIPLLRAAGASALSVCANVGNPHQGHGSVPAEFVGAHNATMFRWHDPVSNQDMLVLYHKAQRDTMAEIPLRSEANTYGGFTRADNTIVSPSGRVALASYVSADNTGPPASRSEVVRIFGTVRGLFPNATVVGSTWDRFVADLDDADIAALPRYSSAWGDPWVAGVSSDPARMAKYRALARARAACVSADRCRLRDPVVRNFTRFLAKNAEHTQGVEGGAGEPGEQLCIWLSLLGLPCTASKDWTNAAFRRVHNADTNIFPGADDAWLESRVFNTLAEQAVPPAHPLSAFVKQELAALAPPSPVGGSASGVRTMARCNGTTLEFSNETGSLERLTFGADNSSSWNRLMDLRYITYRDEDKKGVVCNHSYCPNPVAGAWAPVLVGIHADQCRVSVEVAFNATLHELYGAPSGATVTYSIDATLRKVDVALTWHNKTSTRLQEATTVFHRPSAPRQTGEYRWEMDKLGEWVPCANVTEGGNQYEHAVWSGVRYVSTSLPARGLAIRTLDAAAACPVLNKVAHPDLTPEQALLQSCFDYHLPSAKDPELQRQINDSMIEGMGINLHSNRFTISGFAQWYPFGVADRFQSQDCEETFRFVIEEIAHS